MSAMYFALSYLLYLNFCFAFRFYHGIKSTRMSTALNGYNRDKRISNVMSIMKRTRISCEPIKDMKKDPLIPMIETIVKSADDRRATSISVLHVYPLTEVTQFMIIIEGRNNRQIQAISLSIENDVLSKYQVEPFSKEGTAASGWMILDYGSLVAHIMTSEMKKFYKLEKKWGAAETMDLSHLLTKRTDIDITDQEAEYLDEDAAFWGSEYSEQQQKFVAEEPFYKSRATKRRSGVISSDDANHDNMISHEFDSDRVPSDGSRPGGAIGSINHISYSSSGNGGYFTGKGGRLRNRASRVSKQYFDSENSDSMQTSSNEMVDFSDFIDAEIVERKDENDISNEYGISDDYNENGYDDTDIEYDEQIYSDNDETDS